MSVVGKSRLMIKKKKLLINIRYLKFTVLQKVYTKAQSTLDNSNLQGKSKKVRVIGSSKKIAGSKEKKQFLLYCEHFNHLLL